MVDHGPALVRPAGPVSQPGPRRRATDTDPEQARAWIASHYTGPWARTARLARFWGLARDPARSALARWLARKDEAWIARYAKALARPPAWYLDRARPPRRE